ncbi:hypothetical protein ACFHW2_34560 [Actinomadura sp. LOL_016]|uniref:hypothetical protein n=1 Tax=unclassified Actinomadura TaxID=2626254 RepID=UPI003A7FED06
MAVMSGRPEIRRDGDRLGVPGDGRVDDVPDKRALVAEDEVDCLDGRARPVRDLLQVRRAVTYCGIPLHRRDAYPAGLTRRAAPGARLLMFGYGPEPLGNPIPEVASWAAGVTADELRTRFPGWELLDVTPGTNPVPTFWFTLRRNA